MKKIKVKYWYSDLTEITGIREGEYKYTKEILDKIQIRMYNLMDNWKGKGRLGFMFEKVENTLYIWIDDGRFKQR